MTSKFPFVFPGEAPQVSDQAMPRGEVSGLLSNVNEVHVCVELNLFLRMDFDGLCFVYVCMWFICPQIRTPRR